MNNYDETTNRDAENTNEEELFDAMSNESLKLFKRALSEALTAKISKI